MSGWYVSDAMRAHCAASGFDPAYTIPGPTGGTCSFADRQAADIISGKVRSGAVAYKGIKIEGVPSGNYLSFGSSFTDLINNIIATQVRPTGGILGELAPYAGLVAQVGATALMPAFAPAIFTAGKTAVQLSEGQSMGLNLSGILGGIGQAIGGIDTSAFGNVSQVLGAGLNIASAALVPSQPANVAVYGAMPSYPPVSATPTMSGGSSAIFAAGAGLASAIAARVAPILAKIAVKLGYRARPSLSRAMDVIRKSAKILGSPEAVAAALGITTAELATLIVSNNQKKRRRMNPANSHALRRAARRIKSFHRLCQHTDLIKTHRRSSYRSGGCMKCGKKRCSC